MSKRFGRNQKRKLLERINEIEVIKNDLQKRIQELTINVNCANALAESFKRKRDESMSTLKEVLDTIDSICKYSSALPVEKYHGGELYDNSLRMDCVKMSYTSLYNIKDIIPTHTLEYINLYALEAHIENYIDTFRKCLHIQYHDHKTNKVSYLMSEHALISMPERYLVNHLVPDITTQMIRELRKSR